MLSPSLIETLVIVKPFEVRSISAGLCVFKYTATIMTNATIKSSGGSIKYRNILFNDSSPKVKYCARAASNPTCSRNRGATRRYEAGQDWLRLPGCDCACSLRQVSACYWYG